MDDPNITMAKYIQLEEEKARRRGQVYYWETATYDKICYDEAVYSSDLLKRNSQLLFTMTFEVSFDFENEYPAIVYNNTLACEPVVSIDFENEFTAIVYNDALISEPEISAEPTDCAKCGNPVDGLYCRHCALLRKKLKEVWFTICDEHNFFQDFLNTFESSNDDSNVVNAPQEPIVFNQDPGEKSLQSPPQIDNQCCYGCGDPLDGIFYRWCTYESCGNDAHIGYNCTPKVSRENSFALDSTLNFVNDSPNVFHPPPQSPMNSYEFCGNDAHYKSDKVIKSSVENLVPILIESEGIPDNACDVPFRDNSLPLDLRRGEDDNLYENLLNINHLIAKIKSLNNNPTPDHVLKPLSQFPIPVEDSDSFLEKSDTSLSYSDKSLPEFETFGSHTEETNSGSNTTYADYSLPKYDSFLFEIDPDQGKLTSVVMKDNLVEPRVHAPNVLTTHSTLMLDSDFIPSDNSLLESEIFYFDIKEKNSGCTTIHADISLPELECFNFKSKPNPGELTSIVDFGIRENILSATNVNLPLEEDHSPLFACCMDLYLFSHISRGSSKSSLLRE
uniref:Uncharacterized protein n=1 Tax=Tanacetum cinerariifolium TaxID=118510 RepID=A0A6L2JMI3_TANCI|nr:hypothetical protein [Tanacetum cinerariifolium]